MFGMTGPEIVHLATTLALMIATLYMIIGFIKSKTTISIIFYGVVGTLIALLMLAATKETFTIIDKNYLNIF